MSRALASVLAVVVLAACHERAAITEPKALALRPSFATDPSEGGPPPARAFGPDTYRTGVFTGAAVTTPGINCTTAVDQSRVCDGFLASGIDGTRLDLTLQIPSGTGP